MRGIKNLKVTVISSWPPLRSGTAIYSRKLYKSIACLVKVTVLANHIAKVEPRSTHLRVLKAWKPGPLAVFQVLKTALMEQGNIYHIQFEFLTFGHPISIILLPVLMWALRLTRKPVVITLHCTISRSYLRYIKVVAGDNLLMIIFQKFHYLAFLALIFSMKLMCFFSSKVIVHNKQMREILTREYKVRERKVFIIHHGVNQCNDLDKGKEDSDSIKILFFGFIRPSKGIDYLVKSMPLILKDYAKAKLIIAGIGPHQQKRGGDYLICIIDLIKSLHLEDNIKVFGGLVPEDKLDYLVKSCDVIVLPYLDYFIEASGVLSRVMDYGKPIICTKVPKFLSELTDGVDCLMVKPGDVKCIAEAILLLLKNRELGETLGKNLRKKARNRYWKDVAKLHVELYQRITGSVNH